MPLVCEVAFAATPLDPAPVWTVVGKVISTSIRRGRRGNEGGTQPGTATVEIDDPARAWDPTNPSSPYAANLVPMRQVRISQVLADATTERLYTGYVEEWSTQWRPTVTTLTCVDALGWFATQRIVSPTFKAAVLADAPLAYYRLGEATGAGVCLDSSGYARHSGFKNAGITSGAFASVGPGALIADPDGAADMDKTGSIYFPAAAAPGGGTSFSIECFIRKEGALAADQIITQFSYDVAAQYYLLDLVLRADGRMEIRRMSGSTVLSSIIHSAPVIDAQWHHVVWTRPSAGLQYLSVDGVKQGGAFTAGTVRTPDAFTPFGAVTGPYELDEFASYQQGLSDARIAEHYRLARGRWGGTVGHRSGTRVGLVCDIVGWPAALRSIDAGVEDVMPPEHGVAPELLTISAAEHLGAVDAVEGGRLYMTRTGVLRFAARTLVTPATVANYANDGTGLRFVHGQPAKRRADVVNHAEVARHGGGVQIAESASSVARHLRHDAPSRTGWYADDQDAHWAALRAVHAGKEALVRLDQLTLNARIGAPEEASCAVRELGAAVAVHLTPPSGPSLDLTATVEGISHAIQTGRQWSVTYDLAVVVPPQTPAVAITAAPDVSVASGVYTALVPQWEYYDSANLHSARSAPNFLTIPVAGDWLVTGTVQLAANVAGGVVVGVTDGTNTLCASGSRSDSGSGVEVCLTASTVWRFAAGAVVGLAVLQNSGAARAVRYYGAWSPILSAVRVG